MQSKTNRVNHDFQIVHYLIGSCHTPDGAYALLCDLHEDRDNAIKSFEAGALREKAKIVRATRLLESDDEADRLEGEADIVEIRAMELTVQKNLAAAIAERTTIEMCMERLQPLRQYAHLPDAQAHEAAQPEEWKFELMRRAEDYMITTGGIPTSHFSTMRMHPQFESVISPHINTMMASIRAGAVPLVLPAPEFFKTVVENLPTLSFAGSPDVKTIEG